MSINLSRVARALLLAVPMLAGAPMALAATPATGTVSPTNLSVTYGSGPFVVSNPSGVTADQGLTSINCSPAQAFPCDNYALTVSLPAGYSAAHPNTQFRVALSYPLTPANVEEFDVYVLDVGGNIVGSAIAGDPEIITLPAHDGNTTYTIQTIPTTALGDSTSTVVTLVPGTGVPPPPATSAATPRFQVFDPTSQNEGASSQGEYSIGFDLKTGNIMAMNEVGNVYRVRPPELLSPAQPQSCQAQWTNVSNNSGDETQVATLDPILWTDSVSGRTFQSNLTTGATLTFTYTDDDGQTWTPASAAPPDGGVDHQTIGTGPYPASSPFKALAAQLGFNYATYYCSQAEAPDFCQRSDDGGASFGPGVPIANGVSPSCGGIHGHVRVSPSDGTAWVPIRNCGTTQGAAVSTDAGVTWNVVNVTGSTTTGGANFDPSIGLASDGSAYYCYVAADGHPHVSVSRDHGATWGSDRDIGAALGVQNAVFVEAIAGDPNRAACGFTGTTTSGTWSANTFTGVWYLYIAATYDGGNTWSTVNATPNDPVQAAGGICNQGTLCPSNPNTRNLLDFSEITMDDKGRIVFGFDKGCVGLACITNPTFANNTFVANMRIARQTGGLSLLSQYDNLNAASAPRAPCLSGTRDSNTAGLNWAAPDTGGSAITAYKVYRGTSPGTETLLTTLSTPPKQMFADQATAVFGNMPLYYQVSAVNGTGEGPRSNELKLTQGSQTGSGWPPPFCALPGVTIASGSTGTATTTPATSALDITALTVAEPLNATATATKQSTSITFTIDVASFNNLPQPPPNSAWKVQWNALGSDHLTHTFFVSFDTQTLPTGSFNYGYVDGTTTPATDQSECTVNPTTGACPQVTGGYNAAGNSIVLTLNTTSALSFATIPTGSTLAPFTAKFGVDTALTALSATTQVLIGGAGTGLLTPTNATSAGSYTMSGNYYCRANAPPQAQLTATPASGTVPLTVQLDGSGTTNTNGDTTATYTFDFGDGSDPVTQSAPMISYTYYQVGLYNPKLSATNDRGLTSTNAASVIIPVAPQRPGGVKATGGSKQVSLSWTASSGAASYNVYMGTAAGQEAATAVLTDITGTSAIVGGLSDGTTYFFTVKAVANGGQPVSDASLEVSAATTNPAPPPAPTSVTVGPGNGQLTLKWTASTGASSYRIYQGTTPGGESATAVRTSTTTSVTVTGLSNGTQYYFTVKALNSAGSSPASSEVNGTPMAPAAPTNVSAVVSDGSVTLKWTAAAGATSYGVYDGTSAGGEGNSAVANASGTTAKVSGLTNGTKYYFIVKGFVAGGYGPASSEVSATPVAPPPPLAAPANVTATAGTGQVTLNWSASTGASSYRVYQGTGPGGESATAAKIVTGTSATVTGLTSGTKYYFTVRAVSSTNSSPASAEVSATAN